MILTYRFRLSDTCNSELTRQARAVNTVWNFCNESQQKAVNYKRKWLSWQDLQNLTSGSYEELDISANTIQMVCREYDSSRRAKKKRWLKWRVSNQKSSKHSLGWIPLGPGNVKFKDGMFVFRKRKYKAKVTRDLKDGQTFRSGSFSQDSLGHWYINLVVDVQTTKSNGTDAIGIDLGLKDFATLSNGEKIQNPRLYHNMESRIAMAQRAKKKKHVKKLHMKVRNKRNDYLHKISTSLVKQHGAIFVGNVNASSLAKTNMAKSVLDAGWSKFRSQLAYKAIRHQVVYKEVNEAYSTQTCSSCGNRTGPRGLNGLGIRQWTCSNCGTVHDRDVNAAKNIVRCELATLGEGVTK